LEAGQLETTVISNYLGETERAKANPTTMLKWILVDVKSYVIFAF